MPVGIRWMLKSFESLAHRSFTPPNRRAGLAAILTISKVARSDHGSCPDVFKAEFLTKLGIAGELIRVNKALNRSMVKAWL